MRTNSPRRLTRALFAACACALGALGCSSSDGSDGASQQLAPACVTLANVCHASFDALAEECHVLGHRNDQAGCAAREDECVDHCQAGEAPAVGGAGGAGGAGQPAP